MQIKMAKLFTAGALALACGLAAPLSAAQQYYQGYGFNAYVSRANGGRYQEFNENGKPTVKVKANEEYTITLHNPLPVRAAVAVTVDGLNTVDGKRSTPKDARKWMVEANSSLTLKGWQTGNSTSRTFVFTDQSGSYASWKEKKDKKEYTPNLGVIGAAWFWNTAELQQALNPPKPFEEEQFTFSKGDNDHKKRPMSADGPHPSAPGTMKGAATESAAQPAAKAGTGMGRQQQNAVREIEFNETAGMYKVKDCLKIFYEFAQDPAVPQPFESDDGDGRFADEMPK